ncbi:hypothetical protein ALT721_1310038 [Alteromonas alvinellae]
MTIWSSHACVILSKSFEHLVSLLYTIAYYRFANTFMITKESFAIVSLLLLYLRVTRPVDTLLTQGSLND